MPKLMRTVIPRIKRSIEERGLVGSLFRSVLLPIHLYHEYKLAMELRDDPEESEFDKQYGVETSGEFGGRIYLSDLKIESAHLAHGKDYAGIRPERFFAAMSELKLDFENYVFVDFGSGKGRALLLASDFPFKKIVGVEFSDELNAIAGDNLKRYRSANQKCKSIETVWMDFTRFELPQEPCVLYFYDPCRKKPLVQVLENIRRSWKALPRNIYIVYVAPLEAEVFDSSGFLRRLVVDEKYSFNIYEVISE
jgi:hypothetical protein